VLAGIGGLLAFLALHAVLITPIWFVAPAGAVVASIGGAAIGVAYSEVFPRLPPRPWTAPAVVLGVGLVLLPAIVIAELRDPIVAMDETGGRALRVSDAEAVAGMVFGFLGPTALAGASVGWLLMRTRRASIITALAALAFAIGPGHNVRLLAGTAAVGKEIAILVAVVGVASVVLVESHATVARGGHGRRRS